MYLIVLIINCLLEIIVPLQRVQFLYLELLIERQLYPRIPLKPMCYMLEKKLFLRGD